MGGFGTLGKRGRFLLTCQVEEERTTTRTCRKRNYIERGIVTKSCEEKGQVGVRLRAARASCSFAESMVQC